ncbi:DUF6538 domain-containing protein [Paracoccus yeei]|uniref:DUF6538 domain-containing protein n=1 Tax=Paracoccus yeei TaxID=147645 RepID=UPI003BF7FC5E
MVLKMPRPTQRQPGSPFYFRARVPADVRSAVGKDVLSYSLGTTDEVEAKRLFAAEYAKHMARWEAIRKGPQTIPLKTIMGLCGAFYQEWVTSIAEEPGDSDIWTRISEINESLGGKTGKDRIAAFEKWYGPTADKILADAGLLPDSASRERLLDRLHDTAVRATETLSRRSEGDYGPDPHENRFPTLNASSGAPNEQRVVPRQESLSWLFSEWEKQARADRKPEKTISDFRHKVEDLIAFLGHDAIRDIKPADVVRWTNYLRDERGLSAKTIGQKYVAAVKRMFSFAKSRAMGLPDPTDGITIKVPKRTITRERGFTDEEARTILTAAKAGIGVSERMSESMRRAIRWVPWICAHTGARVTEITQLRKEDLNTLDGIPYLRITPEAGSVKSGSYRLVPLHPQLVREGLLKMVQALPDGPIFRATHASASGVSGRIGEWVRTHAKITDPDIQPNHAWRHRLKTVCRDHGVADEWADHLQGHANPRAAEGYGERTVKALYREVCKLPDYGV